MIPEKIILKQTKDLLKVEGFYVIRNHQSMGSHLGLSDITAIKDGVVLFIETKTKTGKLSPHQIKFQNEINRHGGNYIVVRDVEDIIKYLLKNNLGRERLF